MFGLYSGKDVKELVRRLRTEYDEALKAQKRAAEELKEENRRLAARVSELESARGDVGEALVHAVKEGERIRDESARAAENDRKELKLLAEKCRLLADRLTARYPDADDVRAFAGFVETLRSSLGETEDEESGLDMNEVLSPKKPLDLAKLCRDLGLMEDGE